MFSLGKFGMDYYAWFLNSKLDYFKDTPGITFENVEREITIGQISCYYEKDLNHV